MTSYDADLRIPVFFYEECPCRLIDKFIIFEYDEIMGLLHIASNKGEQCRQIMSNKILFSQNIQHNVFQGGFLWSSDVVQTKYVHIA